MSSTSEDADILRHEISEDGVHWRPYDPSVDPDHGVHRRIEFAPPPIEDAQIRFECEPGLPAEARTASEGWWTRGGSNS